MVPRCSAPTLRQQPDDSMRKYRKRILFAAAVMVFLPALLVLFFREDLPNDTSRVSVRFVQSTGVGNKVVFAVSNRFDFPIAFEVYTRLKDPDGLGYQSPVATTGVMSNVPGNSVVTFTMTAVSTNQWAPFIGYADNRFWARARFRLDEFAFTRRWWRVRDILRAEIPSGIAHGPDMLGNHPALPAR